MQKKLVLVAPLDWGLGHAARCIPVIRQLLLNNVDVVIAAENRGAALLAKEFPQVPIINFPNYAIRYPQHSCFLCSMIFQLHKIAKGIRAEQRFLRKKVLPNYAFDAIISDNRYGIYHPQILSVIIIHQTNIQLPFVLRPLKFVLNIFHHRLLKRFNEIWIPDTADHQFAGKLSHIENIVNKVKFMGLLSRFQNQTPTSHYKYDVLILLSGVEPQRSILESHLLSVLENTSFNIALVQGKTEHALAQNPKANVQVFSFHTASQLISLLHESKVVIARSGYSTIMDLLALGKTAILIPTPGQTEQEYLAKFYSKKERFYSLKQNQLYLIPQILPGIEILQHPTIENSELAEKLKTFCSAINKNVLNLQR